MGTALVLAIGFAMISHKTEFEYKDPHNVTIAKS